MDQSQMNRRWDGEMKDHDQGLVLDPVYLCHEWRCRHEWAGEMILKAEKQQTELQERA